MLALSLRPYAWTKKLHRLKGWMLGLPSTRPRKKLWRMTTTFALQQSMPSAWEKRNGERLTRKKEQPFHPVLAIVASCASLKDAKKVLHTWLIKSINISKMIIISISLAAVALVAYAYKTR